MNEFNERNGLHEWNDSDELSEFNEVNELSELKSQGPEMAPPISFTPKKDLKEESK